MGIFFRQATEIHLFHHETTPWMEGCGLKTRMLLGEFKIVETDTVPGPN